MFFKKEERKWYIYGWIVLGVRHGFISLTLIKFRIDLIVDLGDVVFVI